MLVRLAQQANVPQAEARDALVEQPSAGVAASVEAARDDEQRLGAETRGPPQLGALQPDHGAVALALGHALDLVHDLSRAVDFREQPELDRPVGAMALLDQHVEQAPGVL